MMSSQLFDSDILNRRCKQPTRCKKFRLLIFLLIYLNLLYILRATNSPIFRGTFWLYVQFWYNAPILLSTGQQQYRCVVPKAVYTAKKYSWRWASLSPETCRTNSYRSIRRSINGICCNLLVSYIVGLMTHGLTTSNSQQTLPQAKCFNRSFPSSCSLTSKKVKLFKLHPMC